MRRGPVLLSFLLSASLAPARLIEVGSGAELRAALPDLVAGDTLRIAAGTYHGGYHASGLHGTAAAPIIIEGAPGSAPRFEKGKTGFHFSKCRHLTLRHLAFSGQSINGINIDDGGDLDQPAQHLHLEDLHFTGIGSGGNHDALKLSGVDDFVVQACSIEGWDGQAIDLVGCHRGIVEHCLFRGVEGRRAASGVQAKGGSANVTVRHCRFEHAGGRPLNLGGSTGQAYFRPPGAQYEARSLTAHDNLFLGGLCAVAFTGLDGGSFHHNTIVQPEKWVFRVLQETVAPGFPPCRKVEFHHNLVLFARAKVGTVANLGPHTAPDTFSFHHNLWHAADAPARSKPELPAEEAEGRHDLDPRLDPATHLPSAREAAPYGRRPQEVPRP